MKRYCPHCGNEMLADELNAVSDLAKCNECGMVSSFAALAYERPAPKNLYEVPSGSRIEIGRGQDNSLSLNFPAMGWKWYHFLLTPFVIFWVGFVGFWTYMALSLNIFFAMFSLPFWYVGVGLVKGLYLNIRGWERVEFGRNSLRLIQGHGNRSKVREIPIEDIQAIGLRFRKTKKQSPSEGIKNINYDPKKKRILNQQPAVVANDEEMFFFEAASDPEQDWVLALLNDVRIKLVGKV